MKQIACLLALSLIVSSTLASDVVYGTLENGDRVVLTDEPCTLVSPSVLKRAYIERKKLRNVEGCYAITDTDVRAVFPSLLGPKIVSFPLIDVWNAFETDVIYE